MASILLTLLLLLSNTVEYIHDNVLIVYYVCTSVGRKSNGHDRVALIRLGMACLRGSLKLATQWGAHLRDGQILQLHEQKFACASSD